MTTITIQIDGDDVRVSTLDGALALAKQETPEWLTYGKGYITRDQQKQAFGLFKVAFGTTDQPLRHEFTRTVLDLAPTETASWACITEDAAAQVIRALEATVAVDTLLGERYAAIRG